MKSQTQTVGGSISGLSGSGLVLQDNGGDSLTVAAGATSFIFPTPIAMGGAYSVTVASTPPNTTCSVTQARGVVVAANVTNIAVACTTSGGTATTSTIGGTVSGLAGSGLVLQDNGGDNLTVASSATSFTFKTPLGAGGTYAVTVLTQPANQTCTVANGSGTVAASNITNIAITCSTPVATYTIGGTVSGLLAARNLTLQNNGGDTLVVAGGSANFTFKTALAGGASYAVTILTQPTGETCTVANGSGTVTAANVTNVAISCAPEFQVGGTVTGVNGRGIVALQLNNGNTLNAGNGSFTFALNYLPTGAAYSVTVQTQPTSPTQMCTVTNGTGTVGSANISNVEVNCLNVGQFVYVVNSTDNTAGDVSAFAINQTTGALTAIPGGNIAADTHPTGIAIDFHVTAIPVLYVSNATSTDVTQFDFTTVTGNGSTAGALQSLGNTGVINETPASIAIAPSGAFLFTGGYGSSPNGAIYGFTLDKDGNPPFGLPGSGLPAAPVTADGPVLGLAIDPTSTLLFATTSSANLLDVYSVAADGTLTAIANSPYQTGNDSRGVVVWPKSTATTGFVYTANKADSTVSAFVYNGTSGNLQPATPYSTGQAPVGIAIDPTGTYLYTANSGDGTVSAFSINQSTGALTALGTAVASGNLNPTINPNPGPVDIKVDPSGQFVYCVNGTDGSVSLFTVSAGALTLSHTYATGTGATAVAIY